MAAAGSKQGGGGGSCCKPPPAAAAADQELDPKYEWQENATSFILTIHLSGFRKQDFRVQVDGAGRLTVRGQRSDAAANARHSRFSKVFQLPSTSNLDDISGRFDAGVLKLTVPKRLPASASSQQQLQPDQAAAAATKQQTKAPPPQEQDQPKAKEDQQAKKPEDAAAASKMPAAEQEKVTDAKSGKAEPEQQPPKASAAAPRQLADATRGKPEPEQQHKAAGAAAPPAAAAADTKLQASTPKPEPPPQAAAGAERKAVDPESLAERVNRRAEEERAKAAAEVEADEAEQQRKACRGFKERVAEELQGLAGSEWAEGLVETVKKNREVIAAAVAAFSLGVLVSSKLFARSRNGN